MIRKAKASDANPCMKIAKLDKARHWKKTDFGKAA